MKETVNRDKMAQEIIQSNSDLGVFLESMELPKEMPNEGNNDDDVAWNLSKAIAFAFSLGQMSALTRMGSYKPLAKVNTPDLPKS